MKKNRKKLVILSLCLVAVLAIGITVAFFTDQTTAVNKIKMGKVDVEVTEKVTQSEKEDVGVLIDKDAASCYVRMYVGIPKGMNGEDLFDILPEKLDDKWKLGDDGYYYYDGIIKPDGKHDVELILFQKIASKETGLKELELPASTDIVVYAEAIQADPNDLGISAVDAFANIKNK